MGSWEEIAMRRRLLSILLVVMVAFIAAACSASTATEMKGKKALFVGRDSGGDRITVKKLKELGYEVTIIEDKVLTPEDAPRYSLIFVSSSVNSGRVGSKLKASTAPVIYAEAQNLGDIQLSGKAPDTDNGYYSGKAITIRTPGHPIASGLKDTVDVYQSEGKIGYVVPDRKGAIIASAPDDEKRAVVAAFEKGELNMNNEPVPSRTVYLYLVTGDEVNQTEIGWKLFTSAVEWAAGGK
jgi:hypothetical protein